MRHGLFWTLQRFVAYFLPKTFLNVKAKQKKKKNSKPLKI